MGDLDERNRGAGAYSTPGVDTRPPEKDFQPLTATPVVRFKLQDVDPPAAVYVRPPDVLQVRGGTNLAGGDTLSFNIRILKADGTIQQEQEQLVVTAGWGITSKFVDLPEGYILSVTIQSASALSRGQSVADAYLQRGRVGAGLIVQELCSDYISTTHMATYPGGRVADPLEGPGNIRSITGTLPAAGAEISEVVPAKTQWRLIAFRYTLTTAVAVANRETTLTEDDGANVFAQMPSTFTQAASLVHSYTYGLGLQTQAGAQALIHTIPLVAAILPPGFRIRTLTTNIQAADQYTAPQYLVEEWTNAS